MCSNDYMPSVETLMTVCGISERQARRWRRNGLPQWAERYLAVMSGNLGAINPAWQGWRIRGDRIEYGLDARPSVSADQMGWFDWFPTQIRDYQRQIEQLRTKGIDISQRETLRETLVEIEACQAVMNRAKAMLTNCVISNTERNETCETKVIPLQIKFNDKASNC